MWLLLLLVQRNCKCNPRRSFLVAVCPSISEYVACSVWMQTKTKKMLVFVVAAKCQERSSSKKSLDAKPDSHFSCAFVFGYFHSFCHRSPSHSVEWWSLCVNKFRVFYSVFHKVMWWYGVSNRQSAELSRSRNQTKWNRDIVFEEWNVALDSLHFRRRGPVTFNMRCHAK